MRANKNIIVFSENGNTEKMQAHIKTIVNKVNERLTMVFNGSINNMDQLHNAMVYAPTPKIHRVWRATNKNYPGLRDLLLNIK